MKAPQPFRALRDGIRALMAERPWAAPSQTSENTMLTGGSYIGPLGGQRPDIRRFALNALGGNVPMARAAVAFISEATTSDDEALRIEAVSICRNAESPAEWWSALNFLRGENA